MIHNIQMLYVYNINIIIILAVNKITVCIIIQINYKIPTFIYTFICKNKKYSLL